MHHLLFNGDFECITEKTDGCKDIPESSSTIKVSKNIPSGFSMCTISSFRNIKNRHDYTEVKIA